jgi:DNA mismatch endonuclease (patch repair protein)
MSGSDSSAKMKRSALMARVRGMNTKPEIAVRKRAHQLGLRYRLHRKDLPGSPDLVFPARRKVIFVHGCFWHRHEGCTKSSTPKTNIEFWSTKFAQNIARDQRVCERLKELHFDVLIIWECQTRSDDNIDTLLNDFLVTP